MKYPVLLIADKNNKIFDIPEFAACGMAGNKIFKLAPQDLIPLPPSSELFTLPGRVPIGLNSNSKFQALPDYYPVSAFIPPGYISLSTPAYKEKPNAKILPLFSYTPITLFKNKFYTHAVRIDKRRIHDLRFIDSHKLKKGINCFRNTKNRLINHLKNCTLTYRCPNAINFFLGRYECPLPASGFCNSACIGCISYQPSGACPSAQLRIDFTPSPSELAETALIHIKRVKEPVVSFGQGCEGEPLLAADVISEAIQIIRKQTKKGTININTNASIPSAVELLCKKGIDSFRVSLNSIRENFYRRYYRPKGYKFKDVIKSMRIAKKYNKFVSINYLIMPGFTDDEEEFREMVKFIKGNKIDMIQWRNLNYDPQRYFKYLKTAPAKNPLGIKNIISYLKKKFPSLKHGYFNIPKEKWQGTCVRCF